MGVGVSLGCRVGLAITCAVGDSLGFGVELEFTGAVEVLVKAGEEVSVGVLVTNLGADTNGLTAARKSNPAHSE